MKVAVGCEVHGKHCKTAQLRFHPLKDWTAFFAEDEPQVVEEQHAPVDKPNTRIKR